MGPAKWTGCGVGPSKGEETGHRDSKREEDVMLSFKCPNAQIANFHRVSHNRGGGGRARRHLLGGEGVFTLPTGLENSHKLFCSCGWWRRDPASKQASDPFSQEEEFSEKTW